MKQREDNTQGSQALDSGKRRAFKRAVNLEFDFEFFSFIQVFQDVDKNPQASKRPRCTSFTI